jgi:hypothetical protein
MTALIVDDDARFAALVESVLAEAGYACRTAAMQSPLVGTRADSGQRADGGAAWLLRSWTTAVLFGHGNELGRLPMASLFYFHQKIARQRQADLPSEAAQERLARTARLGRAPAPRVKWARLARLMHLRQERKVAAEPAPQSTASA